MWFLLLLQVYSSPVLTLQYPTPPPVIKLHGAILATFKTERDCNVQLAKYIETRKDIIKKHGMNPTCITMYDNEAIGEISEIK